MRAAGLNVPWGLFWAIKLSVGRAWLRYLKPGHILGCGLFDGALGKKQRDPDESKQLRRQRLSSISPAEPRRSFL